MKQTAGHIAVFMFLIFVSFQSLRLYVKEQGTVRRLRANIEALNTEAEQFRTRDGHLASRIAAQELTIAELRRAYPRVTSQLRNLYIPPQRVQSYTETAQQLQATVSAPVSDTVIIYKTDTVSLQTISYSDVWLSISGEICPGTAKLSVAATDTISRV
jgi:hypothetical protein